MSQHDYNIANQTAAAFRADLNLALGAIQSTNSGTAAPSTTIAYQYWYDTTNNILKLRNANNDGWIDIGTFDQTEGTFTAAGAEVGATGGGNDKIFWENDQTVTSDYTITDGQNAMSAGPITISSGITVTIGTGETWTVV